MPEISVIIAAYIDTKDKQDWFNQSLTSLKIQSFKDWEAIIIDDHSPMTARNMEDNRFRWLTSSYNQGPAKCRNTAVALARGNAILPLDSDDLLADADVLENMYNLWKEDPTKIIYGNMNRLQKKGSGFIETIGRSLPEYTFELIMNLNGIVPVTAMHSIDCHYKAGGWKPSLEFALEDVEYWIAAGKAGFCGKKLDKTTLIYRKHNDSRSYKARNVSRQEISTRKAIEELHEDVYGGNFPMGCCGSGGGTVGYGVQGGSGQSQSSSQAPGVLDQVADNEKVWVEYTGRRSAKFGMVSNFIPGYTYDIHGIGHHFEIHVRDAFKFRSSGRGLDFSVGVNSPLSSIPELEVAPTQPEYKAPEPEMAELITLDSIASPETETTPDIANEFITEQPKANGVTVNGGVGFDLAGLGMNESIKEMLETEQWTVEMIAESTKEELMGYPGIGAAKASKFISNAIETVGE